VSLAQSASGPTRTGRVHRNTAADIVDECLALERSAVDVLAKV
jgi:hypothetical protein